MKLKPLEQHEEIVNGQKVIVRRFAPKPTEQPEPKMTARDDSTDSYQQYRRQELARIYR